MIWRNLCLLLRRLGIRRFGNSMIFVLKTTYCQTARGGACFEEGKIYGPSGLEQVSVEEQRKSLCTTAELESQAVTEGWARYQDGFVPSPLPGPGSDAVADALLGG